MLNKKELLYSSILDSFNNFDLPYAILKNYENFPNVENDLDIIIDFKFIDKFLSCMEHISRLNGYKYCIENTSYNSKNYKCIIFLIFGYSKETKTIFNARIELFSGIYSAGIIILSSNQIIPKRIKYKSLYVVSPDIEFLVLIFAIHNSAKVSKNKIDYFKSRKFKSMFFKILKIHKNDSLVINNYLKNYDLIPKKLINNIIKKEFFLFINTINKIKFRIFIQRLLISNFRDLVIILLIKKNKLLNFLFAKKGLIYKTKFSKDVAFNIKVILLRSNIFRHIVIVKKMNIRNIYLIFSTLSMGGIVIQYEKKVGNKDETINESLNIINEYHKKMNTTTSKLIKKVFNHH